MASEGSGPPQSQVNRFSHTIDSRPVSVSTITTPPPTNDSGGAGRRRKSKRPRHLPRKRLRDNTDDTTAVNVKKVRCKMSSGDISMGGTSSDDVICIDSDSDTEEATKHTKCLPVKEQQSAHGLPKRSQVVTAVTGSQTVDLETICLSHNIQPTHHCVNIKPQSEMAVATQTAGSSMQEPDNEKSVLTHGSMRQTVEKPHTLVPAGYPNVVHSSASAKQTKIMHARDVAFQERLQMKTIDNSIDNSDCSIDQPQNQIGGNKGNAKFCGEHQHTEVNVDPSTQFATLKGSSTVAQSSPLVRCSLLSISKEQKSLALTQASLTNQQHVARTQLVHAESRQKGSTRTPIKADMRGGRRTPPPRRKCSESIQSNLEAAIVSENRFSNDSHCSNVSNNGNIHSRISLESDKTETAKQKRTRCNQCIPCRTPDCGKCLYCKDKSRYRKACKDRKDCVKWNSPLEVTSQDEGVSVPSTAQHTASSSKVPVNRFAGQESQPEMLNDDDESFQLLFNEAIEDCKVSVFIAKCGVTGPPGSGKSHLRALILNKKRPVSRKSTAIAAAADQASPDWIEFKEDIVEIEEIKDGSRVKWYVVDTSKMSGLAAKTMYRHQKMKEKEQSRSTTTVESVSNVPSSSERRKFKVTNNIRKKFKDLRKKCVPITGRKRKYLDKMKLVYLVDAGGQPQFQEIMPMFVRNSSVNILVHKLPEKLSDRPEFDYEVDGMKFSVPEEMLVTNREMIEQSVRSICSCNLTHSISQRATNRPPKPYVVVVGMFKDKCSNRALEEKHVGIRECLAKYEKIEVCRASRDKPVFAFDASESGWAKNGETLATLRTNIQQICESLEVEIPLRWFIFLEILKEYSKDKNYISLPECYDVANDSDVRMSQDQVDEALQFFDELNMILHYSTILPNVVFCKPEFLFNKVSQIIVASFDCRQPVDIARSDREKFRKTGIFSTELLNKTHHVFGDLNNIFKREDLLFLLKNLCIIADLGNDQYFMPCVLPLEHFDNDLPVYEKYRRIMGGSGIKGPLFISFETEFSPRGLFCASIAYLAKLPSWVINRSHSPGDVCRIAKRNVIEFEFYQQQPVSDNLIYGKTFLEGNVLIADRTSHFEVYSTCDAQYCPQIRKEIYLAFRHAAESLSYDPKELDITVGFVCEINCEKPKPHGTVVNFRKEGAATEKCLRNRSKRPIPLTSKSKQVWFNKVVPDSNPPTNPVPLSLILLMDEVASETIQWKDIGLELELKHIDIQKIAIEQNNKIDDCFREMFAQWERRCTSPFTWKTIIEALEAQSVNELCLARDLRTKYLEQGQNSAQLQQQSHDSASTLLGKESQSFGQNTEFLPQLQQQESHDLESSLLGKQTSQGLGTAAFFLPPVRPEHSSSTSQSTEGQNTEFHPHLQQQSHGSAFSQLGKGSQGLGTTVILPPVLPEHSPSISQSTKLCSFWQLGQNTEVHPQLQQQQSHDLKSSQMGKDSHTAVDLCPEQSSSTSHNAKGQNTEFHPQLQQQESHASAFSQLGKQLQGLDTAVALPPVLPEHSPSTIQITEDMSTIPKSVNIWQFIVHVLTIDKHEDVITWLNKDERIFQIHNSNAFTNLWREHKGKPSMTWKNVQTSIGAFYKKNILTHIGARQQHIYQFSTDALKEYNTTGPPEKTKPFPDTHQSLNQNQESLTQEPEVSNSRETAELKTTLNASDQDEDGMSVDEYITVQNYPKASNFGLALSSQSLSTTGVGSSTSFYVCASETAATKVENSTTTTMSTSDHYSHASSSQSESKVDLHSSISSIADTVLIAQENIMAVETQVHDLTITVQNLKRQLLNVSQQIQRLNAQNEGFVPSEDPLHQHPINQVKFLNKGQTIQDQAKNLWPRSLVIPKFEENDGIAESDSLIHMAETAALKALHQIKDNHSRKDRHKLGRVVTQIPFIDPVEILECDHHGMEHTLVDHGITLTIPEGAVPVGKMIHIEMAVTLYGPFIFPSGTRPISPILWLCPQEEIKFSSPILVTLPHFLTDLSQQELTQLGVGFAKADHHGYSASKDNCTVILEYKPCSSQPQFSYNMDKQGFGTLETKHCCLLCLTANQCPELARHAGFVFSRIDYEHLSLPLTQVVDFCITFFLPSCLKVLETQFPDRIDMRKKRFNFKCDDQSEPHLKITIQDYSDDKYHSDVFPLEGKIDMTAVDIWARKSFSEDEIKLEHDSHMYPPRVTVKFRWKNLETYPKFCTIPVAVTGSNSSLDDEVNLPFASHSENPSSSLLSDTNETRLSSHSDLQSSGRVLTERKHLRICQYIRPMEKHDIILLGQALGLLRSNIRNMERLPDDMIDAWLIQADDVPITSSPPSWLSLCKALDEISQPGIAENIRQNELATER